MVIPTMKTLKEAAQITGLSYDHLRKLCLQDKIVYVRAGSKFLINMEKLVDFLNTGEKPEQLKAISNEIAELRKEIAQDKR